MTVDTPMVITIIITIVITWVQHHVSRTAILKRETADFSEIPVICYSLTLSARHPFQNFSTPCILNVNNTGAKQRSIMK
jgi:hypothetical protein